MWLKCATKTTHRLFWDSHFEPLCDNWLCVSSPGALPCSNRRSSRDAGAAAPAVRSHLLHGQQHGGQTDHGRCCQTPDACHPWAGWKEPVLHWQELWHKYSLQVGGAFLSSSFLSFVFFHVSIHLFVFLLYFYIDVSPGENTLTAVRPALPPTTSSVSLASRTESLKKSRSPLRYWQQTVQTLGTCSDSCVPLSHNKLVFRISENHQIVMLF